MDETMDKKRPLSELMRSTMDKIREMADTNTIVGQPITTADGVTLINGAMGITRIQRVSNFTIGTLLVLATIAVVLNLIRSRAGRAITAIRDNEIAAQSIGINLTHYKRGGRISAAAFRFCVSRSSWI